MAIGERQLGAGGVLAWNELREENQRLVKENAELRRRLDEYEAQLFPAGEGP